MLHVKKLRELGRGITGYIRSHLWVSIMGSLMLLFLLVVLIFQGYLKNAYYNYLLDETWKTESAVLSVASNSFDSMLEQALQVCGLSPSACRARQGRRKNDSPNQSG